jgi:hypothetical protein
MMNASLIILNKNKIRIFKVNSPLDSKKLDRIAFIVIHFKKIKININIEKIIFMGDLRLKKIFSNIILGLILVSINLIYILIFI